MLQGINTIIQIEWVHMNKLAPADVESIKKSNWELT